MWISLHAADERRVSLRGEGKIRKMGCEGGVYEKSRMKPLAGRSGERKGTSFSPAAWASASAARYPLRTAPSMVAGQPVAVQSPARKTRGQAVVATGRCASIPGRGE